MEYKLLSIKVESCRSGNTDISYSYMNIHIRFREYNIHDIINPHHPHHPRWKSINLGFSEIVRKVLKREPSAGSFVPWFLILPIVPSPFTNTVH